MHPLPSSTPRAAATGSAQVAVERGPIELVGWDPALERAQLLARTTIAVLATTFVTAVGLTLVSLAQTPVGWGLTGVAAVVGLVVPSVWHKTRARGTNRLPVWHLAPHWAEPVAAAATQADRLRQLAARSPAGPIADHFDRLAFTAEGYVMALHQAAVQADAATGGQAGADPELEEDLRRIVAELSELVEAADALRRAQRRHLDVSPLAELTAQTEQLTAAIEADAASQPSVTPSVTDRS
ncbi:MAG: hypothetical protein OEV40_13550 [Acidimicrobiia bacterium]|nr:hypothetical protein [Acidimicrobiia bacterium]